MGEFELNVSKTGNKFLLYIPKQCKENLNFPKGLIVKLWISYNGNFSSFITRYNEIITIRQAVAKELGIYDNCKIRVIFEKFLQPKRSSVLFYKNKLDLLYFLPEKSRKGSDISFEELIIGGESFLNIFSMHNQGSSRKILLKRFIEPNIFGKLLGQIQSEGTKSNFNLVEFCNKNLLELRDFVKFLESLNIQKENLSVKIDYHPIFERKLGQISKEFIGVVGMPLNYKSVSNGNSKGYSFKIIFRNTVVSELILGSLNRIRDLLENEALKGNLLSLAEGYLSKILCGDGTFEFTSMNRKRFQARIKVYDGNLNFLKHYSLLLNKFGFKAHVNKKYSFVRAMCNYSLAKRLIEIQAFDTNKNFQKIQFFLNNIEATTIKIRDPSD